MWTGVRRLESISLGAELAWMLIRNLAVDPHDLPGYESDASLRYRLI